VATIFLAHPPAVLQNYFGARAVAGLQTLATLRFNASERVLDTAGLISAARDCAIIVTDRQTAGSAELFGALPRLVAFQRCAVDIRNVDVAQASRHGILVTQASPGFASAVAEWAIGAMIDLARHISASSAALHAGAAVPLKMGRELRGATLGVIGYGHIGRSLCRLAQAFQMRILVNDPHVQADDPALEQLELAALLAAADFVVCLASASAATENLMNAAAFAAMKPGAWFINAARGDLVDDEALLQALDSGHLAGCAVDVGRGADQMPGAALARHPRVLATPHSAALTPAAIEHQALEIVAQAAAILDGRVPDGSVNPAHARRLQPQHAPCSPSSTASAAPLAAPFHSSSRKGRNDMTAVRWGILSTARIGTQKVIPAMLKSRQVEVAAIASRDLPRAEAAAAALGIATAYGSYEALLADATIEAIYNPLPNHLHVPLTLAAAQAGKHVLCEKPMALNAAELEVLRPYAARVHIREAFMVRCHPQWIAAREQLRQGVIGELNFMQVPFSYFNDDPANIRNLADIGGGALYDIGCYAIVAGRWFFEREPQRVIATIDRDPVFRTDRMSSALLDFGGGAQLALSVSTQSAMYQRIQLIGTRGRIEIEIPFNAPPERACRYWIDDASALDGSGVRTMTVEVADQYQLQAEAFSSAVRTQRPDAAALDDAIANLRIIDALFTSAGSGRFERP
jgi:phosphoglycerate dehydrogenase-like enzyme/predicted dehydrogenase